MKFVEPIRDKEQIKKVKQVLKSAELPVICSWNK